MINNASGALNISDCLACPGGRYCGSPGSRHSTGPCASGHYCTSGLDISTPNSTSTYTGAGGVCQPGHFCPLGSVAETPCAPGTYNTQEGQTRCLPCEAGHYCPLGAVNFSTYPCPAGFYCPPSAASAKAHACPPGTFSSSTGRTSLQDCQLCTAGKICSSTGLVAPDGVCAAGWFCTAGAQSARPTPVHNTTTAMCEGGGLCPTGSFCPAGVSAPKPCSSGQYCSTHGLAAPSGQCEAGVTCPGGDVEASPALWQCPRGSFCPTGSSKPTPCPSGTFSNKTGLTGLFWNAGAKASGISAASASADAFACTQCTPGQYCSVNREQGLTEPTGACSAGFYCPGGQNDTAPAAYTCPPGHFCPKQSVHPAKCPGGTFAPGKQSAECSVCPAGNYCDSNSQNTLVTPAACEKGHYCPNGTSHAKAFPCPPGRYNPFGGKGNFTDCKPCPAGKYCETHGLTSPTGVCEKGFYCPSGAKDPYQQVCATGSYCPAESTKPQPCQNGTFSTEMGLSDARGCVPCKRGFYCTTDVPEEICDAGYVCEKGSSTPQPVDSQHGYRCQPGTYCPRGAVESISCPVGTFNNQYGQGQCTPCGAELECLTVGLTEGTPCGSGYYCPGGGRRVACPEGTYSNKTRLSQASDCLPCAGGKHCTDVALQTPQGPCSKGFFCAGSASSTAPFAKTCGTANGLCSGMCPAGHYCEGGTASPTRCPAGTFRATPGATAIKDCTACTPGEYCQGTGLNRTSGPCDAGYYCPATEKIGTSVPETFFCPPGSFCLAGSPEPALCPAGTYQDQPGRSTCRPCAAGYVCAAGTVNTTATLCPEKYYCPEGAPKPQLCPDGTYANGALGLVNASQCTACAPAAYCREGRVYGVCSAGFVCFNGSDTPRPTGTGVLQLGNFTGIAEANAGVGQPCPRGHYCRVATVVPEPCPPSFYRGAYGAQSISGCHPCPDGRTCLSAGTVAPSVCPVGHFCTNSTMAACPVGTYLNTTGSTYSAACQPCVPGYQCSTTGLRSPITPCPAGFYCPASTHAPKPCLPGAYAKILGAASTDDCAQCPAGYFCANGTAATFVECAQGTVCPTGSAAETPCPAGSYCPARSARPAACSIGHYCPEASPTPTPCPTGYYCPAQSVAPRACPLGHVGRENISALDFGYPSTACAASDASTYRQLVRIHDTVRAKTNLVLRLIADNVSAFPALLDSVVCKAGFYCPSASAFGTLVSKNQTSFRASMVVAATSARGDLGVFEASRIVGANSSGSDGGNASAVVTTLSPDFYRVCPAGYYCGAGVATPQACPQGTANPLPQQVSSAACQNCAVGKYSSGTGAVFCTPCGSYADTIGEGAQTCACEFLDREYQPSDSSCVCKLGYSADSVNADCYIKTHAVCEGARLSNGECAGSATSSSVSSRRHRRNADASPADAALSCEAQCSPQASAPRRWNDFGECECAQPYTVYDDLCGPSCNYLKPTLSCSGGGTFRVTSASGDVTTYTAANFSGTCAVDAICEPVAFEATSSVAKGVVADEAYFADLFGSGTMAGGGLFSGQSQLNGTGTDTSIIPGTDGTGTKYMPNPIVCLNIGSSLLFACSAHSFPQYAKDNLLNSNDAFDYGAFRDLQRRMLHTNLPTSLFVHQFDAAGLHVFTDYFDQNKRLFVHVVGSGQSCTADGSTVLSPSSQAGLTAAGAVSGKIKLEPNWMVIAICIAGMFVGTMIVVLGIKLRSSKKAFNPYHSVNTKALPAGGAGGAAAKHKEAADADAAASSGAAEISGFNEAKSLEGFGVKHFLELLDDQSEKIAFNLNEYAEELRTFYRSMGEQTDAVKGAIHDKDMTIYQAAAASQLDKVKTAGPKKIQEQQDLLDLVQDLLDDQWLNIEKQEQSTLAEIGALRASKAGFGGLSGAPMINVDYLTDTDDEGADHTFDSTWNGPGGDDAAAMGQIGPEWELLRTQLAVRNQAARAASALASAIAPKDASDNAMSNLDDTAVADKLFDSFVNGMDEMQLQMQRARDKRALGLQSRLQALAKKKGHGEEDGDSGAELAELLAQERMSLAGFQAQLDQGPGLNQLDDEAADNDALDAIQAIIDAMTAVMNGTGIDATRKAEIQAQLDELIGQTTNLSAERKQAKVDALRQRMAEREAKLLADLDAQQAALGEQLSQLTNEQLLNSLLAGHDQQGGGSPEERAERLRTLKAEASKRAAARAALSQLDVAAASSDALDEVQAAFDALGASGVSAAYTEDIQAQLDELIRDKQGMGAEQSQKKREALRQRMAERMAKLLADLDAQQAALADQLSQLTNEQQLKSLLAGHTQRRGSKLQEERDARMCRLKEEAAKRSAERKRLSAGRRVSVEDLDVDLDLDTEESADSVSAAAKKAHTVEELKRIIATRHQKQRELIQKDCADQQALLEGELSKFTDQELVNSIIQGQEKLAAQFELASEQLEEERSGRLGSLKAVAAKRAAAKKAAQMRMAAIGLAGDKIAVSAELLGTGEQSTGEQSTGEPDTIGKPDTSPVLNTRQSIAQVSEAELQARFVLEAQELQARLQKEASGKEQELLAQIAKKQEQLAKQKQEKLEELQAKQKDMSASDAKALVEDFDQKYKTVERQMESSKKLQTKQLKDKLKARKRAKEQRLKQTQSNQQLEAELHNDKQVAEEDREVVKRQETQMLAAKSLEAEEAGTDSAEFQVVIASVLEARHRKELVEVEGRKSKMQALAVGQAEVAVDDRTDEAVNEAQTRQEQEMAALSDDVTAKERKALQKKHLEELSAISGQFKQEKKVARQMAIAETDASYAQELLDLRDKHYEEVSSTLAAFDSGNGDKLKQTEAQLEEKRKQLDTDVQNQASELEADTKRFEEEHQKQMEEELKQFETEQENQRVLEVEEADKMLKTLQKRKAVLAAEKKIREAAANAALQKMATDEHSLMMNTHEKELQQSQSAFASEKNRQKSLTAQKLQQKRMSRLKKKRAAATLQAVTRLSSSVTTAPTTEQDAPLQATETQSQGDVLDEDLSRQRGKPDEGGHTGMTSSEDEDEDEDGDLPDQVLFTAMHNDDGDGLGVSESLLEGFEPGHAAPQTLLERLAVIEHTLLDDSKVRKGVDNMDTRDANWELTGGAPNLVAPESITGTRYIAYRFGLFLVDLLHSKLGFPKPAILLAATLPAVAEKLNNNYSNNAYRRSFFFERASGALFVRIERLDAPGSFAIMLAHTLAHLKVGAFADDGAPEFLKEYYAAIKCYCSDIAVSRSTMPLPATSSDDATTGTLQNLLVSNGFDQAKTEEQRAALVHVLLRFGAIGPDTAAFIDKSIAEKQVSHAKKELDLVQRGGMASELGNTEEIAAALQRRQLALDIADRIHTGVGSTLPQRLDASAKDKSPAARRKMPSFSTPSSSLSALPAMAASALTPVAESERLEEADEADRMMKQFARELTPVAEQDVAPAVESSTAAAANTSVEPDVEPGAKPDTEKADTTAKSKFGSITKSKLLTGDDAVHTDDTHNIMDSVHGAKMIAKAESERVEEADEADRMMKQFAMELNAS